MTALKVFISSTCYDLQQIRLDLGEFIESLGFEPILSESDSFPVDPLLKTAENCLERVDTHADILVLIVGGRYGSISDTGRSITNREYLHARAKGIPVYVFVLKSTLSLLDVWRENPDADYRKVVQSPKLFEFVSSMRDDGNVWTFPFETAQDITSTLRKQLAYLCGDALRFRTRVHAAGLPESLRKLSAAAQTLIIERPMLWEDRLFSHVLADGLAKCADQKRDVGLGVAVGPGPRLDGQKEIALWAATKMQEAIKICDAIRALIKDALPKAKRPRGTPGDPEDIVYVAQRVASQYRAFIEWTLDCRSVNVDPEFRKLVQVISNYPLSAVDDIERFSGELRAEVADILETGVPPGEERTILVTLTLREPDFAPIESELAHLGCSKLRVGAT